MKKKKKFTYFFLIGILVVFSLFAFIITYDILNKQYLSKPEDSITLLSKEIQIVSPEDIKPQPKPIEKSNTVEVLISSVGDCTLGTDEKFSKDVSLPAIVQNNNNDYSYLFGNVADIFKNDDITTANLENTFTNSKNKRPDRQFNFKGNPELAKALTLGYIEGVNLSNNHIYDYTNEGFQDTIKTLKSNNINYFGEGNQWLTTSKGIKFAFLGYTGWSNDNRFLQTIKKDIQKLKSEEYVVIINIHWVEEGSYTPNKIQKSIAHFAIDNGADLIIGHHPHVVQEIEIYKNRFIFYSLANFCFGGNNNPSDKDTFIAQSSFKFTNNKLDSIGIKVIPCSVSSVNNKNDYRPTPLTGDSKNRVFQKLNNLSPNLDFKLSDNFNYIKIN